MKRPPIGRSASPGLLFEDVRRNLQRYGFAVAHGSVAAVKLAMMAERFVPRVDNRSTASLTPHAPHDSPPRSLSAVYGLSEQPLHSDGAHLPNPPDIVVLHSTAPSATSTVIWPASVYGPDHIRFGVFTVRGNGVTFLASAYEHGRLRYDPVVMTPADALARQAVQYLAAEREGALEHAWDEPDLLLFIDNRKALHARNAVVDEEEGRTVTRLAYDYPGAT